ncbi:MAG TPA: class I SAM-dependent methyltransferase [Chthonomonadaceae bacterium]|nr:class I SAM-dependent methyltransferase [Chthonomonadaceae bacterium]
MSIESHLERIPDREQITSQTGRAAALAWLATEAGAALLAEAARLPPDRLTRLTRLRRQVSPELAAATVELQELRQRARAKFSDADTMFFTPEGLEQSTGEAIARYRAARFPEGAAILDACCGIGGDARALAARGPVLAVDRDPAAAVCARANAAPSAPLFPLCADMTALDLARLRERGVEAALFDPSRRVDRPGGGRRRARSAEAYSPPLSWLEALRAPFPALAVKVSPALPDEDLTRWGARVEFLSDQGECKEAALWFGPLAEMLPAGDGACATVLRAGAPPATLTAFACAPPALSEPRAWLYEPDPAVIRAHLIPQVASLLDAAQLDRQIAYLTADTLVATPFATAYRVLDWLPFQLKSVQARLRALGRRVTAIKRRGVPLEPETLRKRLTGAEDADASAIVVLTRLADRPIALLCEA